MPSDTLQIGYKSREERLVNDEIATAGLLRQLRDGDISEPARARESKFSIEENCGRCLEADHIDDPEVSAICNISGVMDEKSGVRRDVVFAPCGYIFFGALHRLAVIHVKADGKDSEER